MTLGNLIQTSLWPEVKAALLSLFPSEEASLGPYERVFRGLRLIVPGSSDMRICVEATFREGLDDEPFDRPWNEWLGMSIDPATLERLTAARIVSHCLWEMTFHGFEQTEIVEQRDELKRRIAELDAMTDEEKERKLIPFEQLQEEIEADPKRPM